MFLCIGSWDGAIGMNDPCNVCGAIPAAHVYYLHLIQSAAILDEVLRQKSDPDSEEFDPRFAGGALPFTISDLAADITKEYMV